MCGRCVQGICQLAGEAKRTEKKGTRKDLKNAVSPQQLGVSCLEISSSLHCSVSLYFLVILFCTSSCWLSTVFLHNQQTIRNVMAWITCICLWKTEATKERESQTGVLIRMRKYANLPPLPSRLLANAQSVDTNWMNWMVFDHDNNNCNIMIFRQTWLNPVLGLFISVGLSINCQDQKTELGKNEESLSWKRQRHYKRLTSNRWDGVQPPLSF